MNVLMVSPGYPADTMEMADAVGSELHLYAE